MKLAICLALILSVPTGNTFAADSPPGDSPPGDSQHLLALVKVWVAGRYDNSRQASADLSDPELADELKHRLMHQLFVPVVVEIPRIPGYLVFQQSSIDGSEDPAMIVRVGLLQFLTGADGKLHQRELNFIDIDAFKNAHRTPAILQDLTLDQFRVDPGCDFVLGPGKSEQEIAGPILPGACRIFSAGLNKELIADDAIVIRPDEYWFLGRFVDQSGVVMWGNASDEPVKMIRLK